MANHTYFRIAGYIATLAMHIWNSYDVISRIQRSTESHVVEFGKLQIKFITIWTLILQLQYATLGLICDLLKLVKKDFIINKYLEILRDTFFSALLWPNCVFVFSSFWSLSLYNVDLVFPSFIDKILSPINNHVLHTAIIAVVLWEITFKPPSKPRNHKINVMILGIFLICYLYVMFAAYLYDGIWLYPIFKMVFGTIYFPIVSICLVLVMCFAYYSQWPLSSVLWSQKDLKKNKSS